MRGWKCIRNIIPFNWTNRYVCFSQLVSENYLVRKNEAATDFSFVEKSIFLKKLTHKNEKLSYKIKELNDKM
ncbi:hypothetical protein CVD28_21840 [Bacillus sp. M6-12]|nr:hypothetical protein CVD28_21840 [Bacillus sp. M6-12]